MSAAITSLAKLGVGTSSTVDVRLDFREFDPGVRRGLKDMNGTRGVFDNDTERVRENRRVVTPRFGAEPTAVELATILPWALGGTPSGNNFPLGNTAPTKYVHFVPNAGKQWLLSGVAVDTLSLRASSGEPLSCDLELIGQDFTTPTGSFPSISLDVSTQPFLLSDCVLTIGGGSARQVRDVALTVHNGIDRERFLNSLTLTALNKLTRRITWAVSLPSGDNDDLWDVGVTGAAVVATFTNGGTSLVLSSPAVRFDPANPSHPFRQEGMLALEGMAYRNAGADPLTVALDSTP